MPEIEWQQCVNRLQEELPSQQFNTWIRPLQASMDGQQLKLFAPNRFIKEFVSDKFSARISELVKELQPQGATSVVLEVGTAVATTTTTVETHTESKPIVAPIEPIQIAAPVLDTSPSVIPNGSSPQAPLNGWGSATKKPQRKVDVEGSLQHQHHLVESYTFDNFVEGKSNQLALAASRQVAENPGESYNPLFLYGGVGLGKTHLMHAVGNALKERDPDAKVVYLHSERFVADMVKALQLNAITDFKRYYRSVDALLIDDIQFLPAKNAPRKNFSTRLTRYWRAGSR